MCVWMVAAGFRPSAIARRAHAPRLCSAPCQRAPACTCPQNSLAPLRQIGANSAWFVRLLMLLAAPLAWPIGKLLDFLLGGEHTVR